LCSPHQRICAIRRGARCQFRKKGLKLFWRTEPRVWRWITARGDVGRSCPRSRGTAEWALLHDEKGLTTSNRRPVVVATGRGGTMPRPCWAAFAPGSQRPRRLRFLQRFEFGQRRAPRLDARINFARSTLQQKGLGWFERRRFYAARVRIASSVGSQIGDPATRCLLRLLSAARTVQAWGCSTVWSVRARRRTTYKIGESDREFIPRTSNNQR
jgi:hypothetical protein